MFCSIFSLIFSTVAIIQTCLRASIENIECGNHRLGREYFFIDISKITILNFKITNERYFLSEVFEGTI